jgi:hypothetical protein
MAIRNIYRENAHRKGIYREAFNLAKRGWYVMANHIPGFDPPPEIEGYIPDIYAIKLNRTFILYIATDAGFDECKYESLKNYSVGFSGMHFQCWIIDAAGRRSAQPEPGV